MQKSKGLFLLKGVLALAIVLAFSGAKRAEVRDGNVMAVGSPAADYTGAGNAAMVHAGGRNVVTLATGKPEVVYSGAGNVMTAGLVSDADASAGIAGSLAWMNLEEAAGKLQQEERPVLIDLYTSWCGWCKQMDRKTYSNKQVAAYLQEKFYPVKVDAETHAVITWKGKVYHFNAGYRSNEFAVYLTKGKLEFPTTIIIPPGGEPQAIPGYMEPKELELLVKYFGEGKYNKIGFDEFQRSFRPSW